MEKKNAGIQVITKKAGGGGRALKANLSEEHQVTNTEGKKDIEIHPFIDTN